MRGQFRAQNAPPATFIATPRLTASLQPTPFLPPSHSPEKSRLIAGLTPSWFVTLNTIFETFQEDSSMAEAALSGVDFKNQLRAGNPKIGLFVNSHSPTVAEQLAYSGYDWLLVDTQHGPMNYERLSAMLTSIALGGAKSMVRVGGYDDRPGIQQALDMGADGVLIPYINTAEEARQ